MESDLKKYLRMARERTWYYPDTKRRRVIRIIAISGAVMLCLSVVLDFTNKLILAPLSEQCMERVSLLERDMTRWYQEYETLMFLGLEDRANNIVNEGYSLDQDCGWLLGTPIKDAVRSFEIDSQDKLQFDVTEFLQNMPT